MAVFTINFFTKNADGISNFEDDFEAPTLIEAFKMCHEIQTAQGEEIVGVFVIEPTARESINSYMENLHLFA